MISIISPVLSDSSRIRFRLALKEISDLGAWSRMNPLGGVAARLMDRVEGQIDQSRVEMRAVAAEPGGRTVRATDTRIAVGPEGGWSEQELEAALDRVRLGSTVLRVETAAVVAGSRAVSHRE